MKQCYKDFYVPCKPSKYAKAGKFSTVTFNHIPDAEALDHIAHMIGLELKCGVRPNLISLHGIKMVYPGWCVHRGLCSVPVCMAQ